MAFISFILYSRTEQTDISIASRIAVYTNYVNAIKSFGMELFICFLIETTHIIIMININSDVYNLATFPIV